AELHRLEHLDLRPEAQQLAVGVSEMGESDDGAPVLVDPLLAGEPAPHVFRYPHGDLHPRQRLLEGARPLLPEAGQLELGRPVEALLERTNRDDARDAVYAHAGRQARDQIPGPALEHETERVDRALDDVALLPVPDPRPAA